MNPEDEKLWFGDEIDDREMLSLFFDAYDEEMASRKDSDYEVVPEQAQKLTSAYAFIWKIAKEHGGRVETFEFSPKQEHVGVTISAIIFYLYGNQLKQLSDVVWDMSALSIDATIDGRVNISFTVPNVFRKKK